MLLHLTNISHAYDHVPVLHSATLHVAPGERVVIMGPSGCGKTTLLRCANLLVKPQQGDVSFMGESLLRMSPTRLQSIRRRIGVVFQHFNLIRHMPLWENVALGLLAAGVEKEYAYTLAAQALESVGLAGMELRFPRTLSGGQQQRAGIARALVGQPDVLLWDEPTASLDPLRVEEVLHVMEETTETSRAAMIIVTHEIDFALKSAHRLLIMDEGRIVEDGPPQDVLSRPQSAMGRQYARLTRRRWSAGTGDRLLGDDPRQTLTLDAPALAPSRGAVFVPPVVSGPSAS